MRIVLFADGWVGLKIAKYLKNCNENIVCLVVHPPSLRNFGKEIIETLNLPKERIFEWGSISEDNLLEEIKNFDPEIAFTIFWAYLLPPKLFNIFRKGCINFHCSFLPYNRGKNPNVWPIIEDTPAGISLHFIDQGIDTGPIIAQQKVNLEITDTAKDLYKKLLKAFPKLFRQNWDKIKKGNVSKILQDGSKGTFHLAKDFKEMQMIDLNKKYDALELINLLRARTFKPYPPAFFKYKDKKVGIRVELEYLEE